MPACCNGSDFVFQAVGGICTKTACGFTEEAVKSLLNLRLFD
jgi:hypothetical protein